MTRIKEEENVWQTVESGRFIKNGNPLVFEDSNSTVLTDSFGAFFNIISLTND